MNDYDEVAQAQQLLDAQDSQQTNTNSERDAFFGNAPDIRDNRPRPPSDLFDVEEDAKVSPDWAARKRELGFEREKPGKAKGFFRGVFGATGNAITRIGAAGAQDSYTAGKVLGGVGGAAKGVVDTTKDLSKIGKGVDAIAGLKGKDSVLEYNMVPGFNLNTIAKAELAPGFKVADTAKAALQDGGALLEIAGRGITAASGRRALDFGDDQRRKYMERRDAFTGARDDMRAKLTGGQRGGGKAAFKAGVQQTQGALALGRSVNEYGIRPEYEYSMNESANINNMVATRTNEARTKANPSFDGNDPAREPTMEIKPREVTFERKAGTDPLNAEPEYQTPQQLQAGKRAKRRAAAGEALDGLGRVLDGSEHGQEAIRKGEYAKGATQATLAGARTVGKGFATAAAAPLGLGMAASAVVDVGTVAAGGLLQAVGGGINSLTGVGAKAREQRALELRNKHYFGKRNFLKAQPGANVAAPDAEQGDAEEEKKLPGESLIEDAQQAADTNADDAKVAAPGDPFFDSARGRRIAERGLRAREPLKEGDYEKGDRDAGLPQIDHGGVFKNFWHNRMKQPMKKVGQGLLKPIALLAKGLGYATGALPLYKYFQNKKRKKAIEAATNSKANRLGGRLANDDFELVNHPDQREAPAAPQYAGPEDQDTVLKALEGRQADAAASRVELRSVLGQQNADYAGATKSRGVKAALKMAGRDMAKENISAWTNFERRHNESRLAESIADRKRERAKDPVTGESFLERQKREYLEWYDKTKRFDYADADTGNVMDRLAAGDPNARLDVGHGALDESDEESLRVERSSGNSYDDSDDAGDRLSAAQSALSGRDRIGDGDRLDRLRQAAQAPVDLDTIGEADSESEVDTGSEVGTDSDDEEAKQAPEAASPWYTKVQGLGPIQPDSSPRPEQVPMGYTPEGYADEQRYMKKLLRKRS